MYAQRKILQVTLNQTSREGPPPSQLASSFEDRERPRAGPLRAQGGSGVLLGQPGVSCPATSVTLVYTQRLCLAVVMETVSPVL